MNSLARTTGKMTAGNESKLGTRPAAACQSRPAFNLNAPATPTPDQNTPQANTVRSAAVKFF